MANAQIQQNFEKFLKEHSNNSTQTYENWIAEIHPEMAKEDLLGGMGDAIIDSKFYQTDNPYLQFWNEHLDEKRSPVKVSEQPDGNESDGSAQAVTNNLDLLSDEEGSPTSAPRRTVDITPGEDLMKFD